MDPDTLTVASGPWSWLFATVTTAVLLHRWWPSADDKDDPHAGRPLPFPLPLLLSARRQRILRCWARNHWAAFRRRLGGVEGMLGRDRRIRPLARAEWPDPSCLGPGLAASTWEDLADRISRACEEWQLDLGRYPSPASKTRGFDSKVPMVTLYRDSAIWCPFCEMVWLALEERRIPYKVEKNVCLYGYGDMPLEFAEKSPELLVPALQVHGDGGDGNSNEESIATNAFVILLDILERPPFTPAKAKEGKRSPDSPPFPSLMPSPGTELHAAAIDIIMRHRLVARQFFKATGHFKRTSAWDSFLWYVQRVLFPSTVQETVKLDKKSLQVAMDECEALLEQDDNGPYFLGDIFSLCDVVFAPMIERIIALARYLGGTEFDIFDSKDKWPHLRQWQQAMLNRPTYRYIAQDQETIIRIFTLQAAFAKGTPSILKCLPGLPEPNSCPDAKMILQLVHGDERDRRRSVEYRVEAAMTLQRGHTMVAAFAARGIRDGVRDVMWPLLDLTLRYVCADLTCSIGPPKPDSKGHVNSVWEKEAQDAYSHIREHHGSGALESLGMALEFLHERISVPRDMSMGAAAHFRASLARARDVVEDTILYSG